MEATDTHMEREVISAEHLEHYRVEPSPVECDSVERHGAEPHCSCAGPHCSCAGPHCSCAEPHCSCAEPHCSCAGPHCSCAEPHCSCAGPHFSNLSVSQVTATAILCLTAV